MEIRNTPILVRVIRFQSLLGVVYLWLWIVRSPFTVCTPHTQKLEWLSSYFIVHSRNTDGQTYAPYIHGSRTILTIYVGLAQACPNKLY